MKVLLKNCLPIFTGNLEGANVPELCEIMTYVSGVECAENMINYFIMQLKKKNPIWYSNTVAMVDAISDVGEIEVSLNKCSLRDRKVRVAKKREPRKPFHVNIPASRYEELTEPLLLRLNAIREMEKSGKNEEIEGLKNININVPDGAAYKRILVEIDLAMMAYLKETLNSGIIKNWVTLSAPEDLKGKVFSEKDIKDRLKMMQQ